MFDKFFDALGDSLFFMIDRFRRLRPGNLASQAESESLADRAKSLDLSVFTDRQKLKAAIQRHQLLVSAVLVIIMAAILVPLAMAFLKGGPTPYEPKAWYYDLATGSKFAERVKVAPPITAHVMACGACGGADEQIVYLERINPEVRAKLDAAVGTSGRSLQDLSPAARREFGITADMSYHEIARVSQSPQWVAPDSPEGEAILSDSRARCPDDSPAVICLPE